MWLWFQESHNTLSLSPDNKLYESKSFLISNTQTLICILKVLLVTSFVTPCMYIFITIYDSAPGMRRGWAKTYAAPFLHIQVRRRRSRFKDLAFLSFFGTWKQQLLAYLCGNGFLFKVMVNQYYVVYRNILQSILPAVIVLFIGDHYWSFIHF